MIPIRVIRVQNSDGSGCFSSETQKTLGQLDLYYHNNDKYPCKEQDCIELDGKFACPSGCSFFHWFGFEFIKIKKHFDIKVMLVENYEFGLSKTQLVYSDNPIEEKDLY